MRTLYLSGDVVLILYTTGRSLELAIVSLREEVRILFSHDNPYELRTVYHLRPNRTNVSLVVLKRHKTHNTEI